MNTPPDLHPNLLRSLVRRHWGLTGVSLAYVPLGFGSHHWTVTAGDGTRCFLTVDDLTMKRTSGGPDLVFAALEPAFRSARLLADLGLDFVVAPRRSRAGAVVERIDAQFSIALFPYREGETRGDGTFISEADRCTVVDRLRALHRATPSVELAAGREDFELPWRALLKASLKLLAAPWSGGPYSEPARALLVGAAPTVREAMDRYDGLVEAVRAAAPPFVITHGEPHPANVIWKGRTPFLVDWDSALLAPPARDLWMLHPQRPGEDGTLTLYRLWWELAEIGGYVAFFRQPHVESADSAQAWRNLQVFARLPSLRALRGEG